MANLEKILPHIEFAGRVWVSARHPSGQVPVAQLAVIAPEQIADYLLACHTDIGCATMTADPCDTGRINKPDRSMRTD